MRRWATWDQLFGIDLRSLALFRICLGALLLLDLAIRSMSLEAHYADSGVMPRDLVQAQSGHINYWSPYFLSGNWEVQALLFVIQALFAIFLLIGYHTWIANLLSWYLMSALYSRNYLILQAGDILTLLLLFWGLFLPMGERWSIDSLYRLKKGARPIRVLSGGSAALLLQVALVYWFAVAFKWNQDWLSGEAVYFALSLDSFAKPLGLWLRQFYPLLLYLSYVTLALELICPTIAFSPLETARCRLAAVCVALLMHLMFDLTLTLGIFAYTSMISWLIFIPSEFWERLSRIRGGHPEPLDKTSTMREPWIVNVAALLLIVYVFAWNVRTLDYPRWSPYYPKYFNVVARALRLDQMWNMFYLPIRDDGWFVVPAQLQNGSVIDLYRDGAPLSWDRPTDVASTFQDQRWRKYLLNLVGLGHLTYVPSLATYLCTKWNRSHPEGEKVTSLQIVFMMHHIYSGNRMGPTSKWVMWNHRCDKS